MNGPAIQCPTCKQEAGLFDMLNESATLTCPVCSTQFSITATVKGKSQVDMQAQKGPADLPEPPTAPGGGGPPTPPPPPPAPSAPMEPALQASMEDRINNLVDDINANLPVKKIVARFLGEKEVEKQEWKGGLSTFNSKLQSLAKELNYSGDLGDLVKDLQEGDALALSGDNVKLDIEKTKSVLIKHLLGRGPNKFPDPDIEGEMLGHDDLMDLDREGASGGPFTPGSVSKAVDTYFS